MLSSEMKNHLCSRLIPFWTRLRDEEYGGYYGWMDSGLHVDKTAGKGCILNSRILWFFSNAVICLRKGGGRTDSAPEDVCVGAAGDVACNMENAEAVPEGAAGDVARNTENAEAVPEGTAGDVARNERKAERCPEAISGGIAGCLAESLEKDILCREDKLREAADWAYRFLRERCIDREKGGVYWSVDYKGEPEDTTKHTYNQAFAVYALSSYFRAYHDREALQLAEELITVIETRCFDVHGYKEALDRDFQPVPNDKLSENGVMAERTMNTLLHVMEAYTEYLLACREAAEGGGAGKESIAAHRERDSEGKESAVTCREGGSAGQECAAAYREGDSAGQEGTAAGRERRSPHEKIVEAKLRWILNLIESRIYNPELHRQEVFFDLDMNSLIDLHSYGHDIEAAWLIDRCLDVLGDEELTRKLSPILRDMEKEVYEKAYTSHSLANECERGVVDTKRVWWVQAEGVVGFCNAWQKTGDSRYREASEGIWQFIREHLIDKREGGEWFWYTDADGNPAMEKPIVEPWKCPYHNGRMCMEIINRIENRGGQYEVTSAI